MERAGDLSELAGVQAEFESAGRALAEVAHRREELIVQALREGRSYRDVAEVVNTSRESIRRVAAGRAALMIVQTREAQTAKYQITEAQTRHYAEIGQGFQTDAYPQDRRKLGFERQAPWQKVAGAIGRELHAVADGERSEPVLLDTEDRLYAFNQLTRTSYTDSQTNLGRLANSLFSRFGTEVRY